MILNVYFNGKFNGQIETKENSDIVFTYADNAVPVSLSMPDINVTYSKKYCIPFFEGLLPEGQIREQLASVKHISSSSTVKMLAHYGADIAGALSITESGKENAQVNGYYKIAVEELGKKIKEKETFPLLGFNDKAKLSLAGAENKIPVKFDGKSFFIPSGTDATNYIIKASGEFAENEYVCTKLAGLCGLPVSDTRLFDFSGTQALLIKRYDRLEQNGKIIRMHQEDFCQALGIMPTNKYEDSGGPGFKTCLSLIKQHSKNPIEDTLNFLKMAVFNYLIGNCDAHGKNFSFVYRDGLSSATLSSFYDIVCSSIYEQFDKTFAMKVGTKKELNRISKESFYSLADKKLIDGIFLSLTKNLQHSAKILEADEPEHGAIIYKIMTDAKKRML